MKASSSLAALLLGLPLIAAAADAVPPAGLRAEGEGRWTEAVRIYEQALARDPGAVALWRRLADIRAHLGDPRGAAAALEQAVRHASADAELQRRLSQAFASAQEPKPALGAINRAVALAPDNLDYLQARAELATWNEDYATALASYRAILDLAPDRLDARLGAARSRARQGDAAGAAADYRAYLEARPDDRDALLEYLDAQAAAGDYDALDREAAARREPLAADRDFWLHLAGLYEAGGRPRSAAAALETAAAAGGASAALHYRAAEAYSEAEDVPAARAAIERALALEPDNLEYLRARADLAAWGADYPATLATYEHLLALAPEDAGALLGIARASAWQGNTDRSADTYRRYVAAHPDVAQPWLEYAEVEAERGDFAHALELLETYRGRFGEGTPYLKQKARVLAWAGRPTAARALLDRLLPAKPDDYDLRYTDTVTLVADHRPGEAQASVAELRRLRPLAKETVDFARVVRTPLRSSASLTGAYQGDSDDVRIRRLEAEATWVASPDTQLFVGGDRWWLGAPKGSGLENEDGSGSADYHRAWVGARHRLSSRGAVDARVGGGGGEDRDRFVYRVGADLWPADGLSLRLEREQDRHAVSPRAVSLGIDRRANRVMASWSPDLLYTVDALASFDTFSDGNERWELEVAPRRAAMRTQRFNLDLGVAGRWFGFDEDPGHGYYAPRNYERYSANAFAYWKISDDDGVGVVLSVGPYKDNTMSGYRLGSDLLVEGTFGLYRDWMLEVQAGVTNNARDTAGASGAFRSHMVQFTLTRRF